jgi:hypothetical protein
MFRKNVLPLSSEPKSIPSKKQTKLCLLLDCLVYSSILKIEVVRFAETSVKFYKTAQCHILDGSTLHSPTRRQFSLHCAQGTLCGPYMYCGPLAYEVAVSDCLISQRWNVKMLDIRMRYLRIFGEPADKWRHRPAQDASGQTWRVTLGVLSERKWDQNSILLCGYGIKVESLLTSP